MRDDEVDRLDKVRGVLIGTVFGDALGVTRGQWGAGGDMLRMGVGGQLTCFAVDALIRTHQRERDKGFADVRFLAWLSLRRWGRLQGVPVVEDPSILHSGPEYDDWLSRVPALVERRGSAPATVRALSSRIGPGGELPGRTSLGAHALVRSMPLGAAGVFPRTAHRFAAVRDIAALTHAPVVADLSLLAARMVAAAFITSDVEQAARLVLLMEADVGGLVEGAVHASRDPSTAGAVLAEAGRAQTAESALRAGLAAALIARRWTDASDAMFVAAHAPAGPSVVAVAGALLGAAYGVEAFRGFVTDLEAYEAVEELAHDYAASLGLPVERNLSRYPSV